MIRFIGGFMSDTAKTSVNKAKWWEIFGFSFNNASTNAVFIMILTYFMIYTTEVYGFAAVVVGTVMTATRLFDAVTDPLIGVLIDRTNSKFGRFRPWILGGAIVSASSFVLLFSGIKTGSQAGDLALVVLIYSLWVIGYTAQTACTKSAQTILTSAPQQRSLVNALGQVHTLIIYIVILSVLMTIINKFGGIGEAGAWRVVGMIIASVQLIYAILVVIALRRKDTPEFFSHLDTKEKPKIIDYWEIFKSNRALQMLIVAASTNKITQTMQGGLTVLFYFYVTGNPGFQKSVPLVTMLFMLAASFIMVKIINRFGRREVFSFSSWGGFLYGFIAIILISLNPGNLLWLIIVLGLNQILITGATDVNLISMIADAADYEYYTKGRFVPGMVGTAFSFIDKIISSFGTLIIGAILTGIGFVSISETPQSDTMFWVVLAMYLGFPAIGHLCSIIAMKFHPLDKETHEKMLSELALRAGAES